MAVVVPTFTCAVAMNFIALDGMSRSHLRSTEQLTRVTAGALSGRLADGFSHDARQVVDWLREDPRVALIEVTDATGKVLYRPVGDPDVAISLEDLPIDAVGSRSINNATGSIAIHRTSVQTPRTQDALPTVEGYLTLALNDHDAADALLTINLLQFGAALLVCLLMVPITAFVVAKWTAPLRSLRQSLALLVRGQRPQPIKVTTQDDLGQLCEAFNVMVASLFEAQTQLSQVNERLEQLVKQRTAEVRHANDKLEAEAQDKSEFLRAVSHDLNAPLRNISGMTQMLLVKYKAELSEDAVNKLERIDANVKHQTELISDLLELSRLRTKEPKPAVMEVGEVVSRIVDNLAFDLEKSDIELDVKGEMPTIYAEKNRMRQVFQNLIDNAIKYMMDATERRITVSVERKRDYEPDAFRGVDVWEFAVVDTGRGIAEEDLDKVFRVFSRSTKSGTHVVAGRGVGLASVKTIVETHGGRIWVESTLGQGAAFRFTLPVDRVSPELADAPANPETAADTADADALPEAA